MNTVILPTAYFPSLFYFSILVKYRIVTIDPWEHYKKQTCRNRCYVYTANGPLPLVVPVIKVNGNHTRVKDIHIAYTHNWQMNHWRAICSAYGNSPYFLYYQDDLHPFFLTRYEFLYDLNLRILDYFLNMLDIDSMIILADEYQKGGPEAVDHRHNNLLVHPLSSGKKTYPQVFSEKYGFIGNLSILDLLFNLGPESKDLLGQPFESFHRT